MGLKKNIDYVPAPFGNGTVPMETYECGEWDEDCKSCSDYKVCPDCGEAYCKASDDYCPMCDKED